MTVLDRWTSMMARRDRHADLFSGMMERFGALESDRAYSLSDGWILERAARRCLGCNAVDRCGAWLQQDGPLNEARRFCPNADLFESLGRTARRNADPSAR